MSVQSVSLFWGVSAAILLALVTDPSIQRRMAEASERSARAAADRAVCIALIENAQGSTMADFPVCQNVRGEQQAVGLP